MDDDDKSARESDVVRLSESELSGVLPDHDSDLPLSASDVSDSNGGLTPEDRSRLVEAINALPGRQKTVVTLHYFEELSFVEIAQVIRLPEARVRQIHKDAIGTLRQGKETEQRAEQQTSERAKVFLVQKAEASRATEQRERAGGWTRVLGLALIVIAVLVAINGETEFGWPLGSFGLKPPDNYWMAAFLGVISMSHMAPRPVSRRAPRRSNPAD
jgi:hypothetical protein